MSPSSFFSCERLSRTTRWIAIAIGATVTVGLGLWELWYNATKLGPKPEATSAPEVFAAEAPQPPSTTPATTPIINQGPIAPPNDVTNVIPFTAVTPSGNAALRVGVCSQNMSGLWVNMPGIQVWIALSGSKTRLASGVTGPAGTFQFNGVAAGETYEVNCKAPSGYIIVTGPIITLQAGINSTAMILQKSSAP